MPARSGRAFQLNELVRHLGREILGGWKVWLEIQIVLRGELTVVMPRSTRPKSTTAVKSVRRHLTVTAYTLIAVTTDQREGQ